ncbi:ThiF family adenylyltransferase [Pseudenhygromyxa sp. WMMC2535]|uniref:HesA/MoeB/ThiF family protein n=1 Tax=Pseudenhygromyxa sp. WMMC2535 TaxID=2712867 RepID=UPI0015540D2E|nr:ThiF family adenylyltransferase [Pseudenhygromyxa sp. WMMC2535]NVB41868.1 ThiF family adenylyltransferase [Pseudenhygromyxa sp. WMMC2535]
MLEDVRFVIVGAGGLGCPALLGLRAAGARRLTVIDHDLVELSNLQRQVLYGVPDLGVAKVDAARWAAGASASREDFVGWRARLDPSDPQRLRAQLRAAAAGEPSPNTANQPVAEAIASERAVVLECSDSPALKFAVHDACLAAQLPVVIGGVIAWRGQAMAVDPRTTGAGGRACYRCLFEAPPPRELAPACATVGVIGAAAGAIGHLMASLAVGLLDEAGDSPAGALHDLDLLTGRVRRLAPEARDDCPGCKAATPQRRPS